MAVLMQTDVKAVPESAPAGIEESGRTRKLGTRSLNHGLVESKSLNQSVTGPLASLLRL